MFWSKKNNNTGNQGEKIAANYLRKKGYRILDFNFFNKQGRRLGEIDIIAKEGDAIVFVEVKTRKDLKAGILPEESINRAKLNKLNKIANFYIKKNNLWESPYRFDSVSIWLGKDRELIKLKHIENIFI